MKGPFYFIVNPRAGGGRTARLWPSLKERLDTEDVDYRWVITRSPGDATRLAANVPEGWVAVAVGGDGTLSETVAGLPTDRTVGLLPTGRGNDFARTAGISSTPFTGLRQLLSGQVRPFDLPFANGKPFLNVAGIGFDAYMNGEAGQFRRRGSIPYLASMFKALSHYRPAELLVEVDGHQSQGKVFLLAIGNCRYFGGGVKICPAAHVDDGLLDICIAGDLKRVEALLALARVLRGTHVNQRKFHYTKAHSVRVFGPPDISVQADGQVVGHLPVTFTLKQRALRVLVPAGAWSPSKVTSIRHRQLRERSLETSP